MSNGTYDALEMVGTVSEWNGTSGCILTDTGERVPFNHFTLRALGFEQPLKVGDRIHFWASESIKITYSLEEIRKIVPQEPDHAALKRLRDLNRALSKQQNPNTELHEGREFTGTVDSFDPKKGYGYIRCDGGETVLLHVTCLRASGYRNVTPGSPVHFQALERPKGWMAFRIHSLG